MLQSPMEILTHFPVRKSKKQKQAFCSSVEAYARSLGYPCQLEKGMMGVTNVVIGDPKTARYLVTAHYDTCAGMLFPNLITPCNLPIFLAYQLVITVMLILPAVLIGILAGFLTRSAWLGEAVYFLTLVIALFLMILGPANQNNANDNTSGVITALEIAAGLPQEYRSRVCFVLFDLEEAGLIGSKTYRKAHRAESENQLVLNLDCVGDGDTIMLFPNSKIKRNGQALDTLLSMEQTKGKKSIVVRQKGFSVYPSDQAQFPMGVGIAALHKSKWFGYYLGRIHTKRDTILEEENVNILRDAITAVIEKGKNYETL